MLGTLQLGALHGVLVGRQWRARNNWRSAQRGQLCVQLADLADEFCALVGGLPHLVCELVVSLETCRFGFGLGLLLQRVRGDFLRLSRLLGGHRQQDLAELLHCALGSGGAHHDAALLPVEHELPHGLPLEGLLDGPRDHRPVEAELRGLHLVELDAHDRLLAGELATYRLHALGVRKLLLEQVAGLAQRDRIIAADLQRDTAAARAAHERVLGQGLEVLGITQALQRLMDRGVDLVDLCPGLKLHVVGDGRRGVADVEGDRRHDVAHPVHLGERLLDRLGRGDEVVRVLRALG